MLSFINMGLLALVVHGLPAGAAYAVWTGLSAVGAVVFGEIIFDEKVNAVQMVLIALIIRGAIGTQFFAQA